MNVAVVKLLCLSTSENFGDDEWSYVSPLFHETRWGYCRGDLLRVGNFVDTTFPRTPGS